MSEFERMRRNVERAKKMFPPGTRIVLNHMDDPYSPVPDGMRGTVEMVDSNGTVFPIWDNGRTLGVVFGEDSFRKLTQQELDEEQMQQRMKKQDQGMSMGM